MYAIIEDSGQQFRVQEGDEILVDLRPVEAGATVQFDQVVLVGGDGKTVVGKPHVAGAAVTAEVISGRVPGPKVEIYKFRKRKKSRRHIGHRQKFISVRITGIKLP